MDIHIEPSLVYNAINLIGVLGFFLMIYLIAKLIQEDADKERQPRE